MRLCTVFLVIVMLVAIQNRAYTQNSEHYSKLNSLVYKAFAEGEVQGEIRNFFMNTINKAELNDYYTNATGIALKYETQPVYGFSVGVHFRSTFKTFGAKLSKVDRITGRTAKWEYELYDLLDKDKMNDINKIQELYLAYTFNDSYLSYGRIETEYTPLLNSSDGRISPFAHQGFWLHHHLNSQSTIDAGFIHKLSPRSTTDWFSFQQGVGLFSNGFLPDGTEANYEKTINSKGLGVLKYTYSTPKWALKAYDIYIHNLLNTFWLETNSNFKNWNFGIQYALQHGSTAQAELPVKNQYIRQNENGQVLSSQISWKPNTWQLSFAYTHAFASGRFLFPKELGRDRFYTSIPRSRLEGLGGANVFVFKAQKEYPQTGLDVLLEFQSIEGPTYNNFKLNKYNISETLQFNTIINYDGNKLLKGLSFEGLFVFRYNQNNIPDEVSFNKSNFIQLNIMTYYRF